MNRTVLHHRQAALDKLIGAGRLFRLCDELPVMTPRSLTPDQLALLDHITREIHVLAERERDDANALMGETTQ